MASSQQSASHWCKSVVEEVITSNPSSSAAAAFQLNPSNSVAPQASPSLMQTNPLTSNPQPSAAASGGQMTNQAAAAAALAAAAPFVNQPQYQYYLQYYYQYYVNATG